MLIICLFLMGALIWYNRQ